MYFIKTLSLKSMNPFFSIIIPCYNSANLLSKGLISLESQIFKNFEIILIDDCSTDDTFQFISNYKNKSVLNIKVFKNLINSGPGETRNFGISKACGQFLSFMDSDDWYEPNTLDLCYTKICSENSEIVFFDFFRCFNEINRKSIDCTSNLLISNDKESQIALCYDSLCTISVKRSLFDGLSIPGLYNTEDSVTIPHLLRKAKTASIISSPLYNYLYRPNSLSSSKSQEIVSSFCESYDYLKNSFANQYSSAIQFRGIRMILYGAIYKSLEVNVSNRILLQITKKFEADNPKWPKNKYISTLPIRKRIFLFLVQMRLYSILRLYVKIQYRLLNRGSK